MGTCFKLHSGDGTVDVKSPFQGKHMVYPILAAAAAAHHQWVDMVDCLSRLTRLNPIQGRIQPLVWNRSLLEQGRPKGDIIF